MNWWQALLLGIVQGLTEFLPVSSSGHLMIFKELLGVDGEGFLDFTVTVHLATVLATLVVFWKAIWQLLKGFFQFKYNDETDYVCKILVSLIPVAVVGFFFKDFVEGLFGESLIPVGVGLCFTAALLLLSDYSGRIFRRPGRTVKEVRNGISYGQAFLVGLGQAVAVAPGISRSGTTIATGLVSGVRREVMAQFSFLMVLIPIIGEQLLDIVKAVAGEGGLAGGVGPVALLLGFVAAFVSGLFACKAMVALVRRARLGWFALYCVLVAVLIFVLA
jgi:undecaprenyl-diphosphatase